MSQIKYLLGLFGMAAILASCGGDSKFSGSSSTRAPTGEAAANPPGEDETPNNNTNPTALPSPPADDPNLFNDSFVPEAKALDVFFGLDSSGSMTDERSRVEQHMAAFVQGVVNANLDVQVTVLGSAAYNFPPGLPENKFALVTNSEYLIHSHNGLRILTEFFIAGHYPLSLREDAAIEIIMVSDDNPRPGLGSDAEDFAGPPGKELTFNAIVSTALVNPQPRPGCDIQSRGEEHITLAGMTGGIVIDICNENWDDLIKQLLTSISSTHQSFTLTNTPDLNREVYITVDDIPIADYSLNAETRKLVIGPSIKLTPMSLIKAFYYLL